MKIKKINLVRGVEMLHASRYKKFKKTLILLKQKCTFKVSIFIVYAQYFCNKSHLMASLTRPK